MTNFIRERVDGGWLEITDFNVTSQIRIARIRTSDELPKRGAIDNVTYLRSDELFLEWEDYMTLQKLIREMR